MKRRSGGGGLRFPAALLVLGGSGRLQVRLRLRLWLRVGRGERGLAGLDLLLGRAADHVLQPIAPPVPAGAPDPGLLELLRLVRVAPPSPARVRAREPYRADPGDGP